MTKGTGRRYALDREGAPMSEPESVLSREQTEGFAHEVWEVRIGGVMNRHTFAAVKAIIQRIAETAAAAQREKVVSEISCRDCKIALNLRAEVGWCAPCAEKVKADLAAAIGRSE